MCMCVGVREKCKGVFGVHVCVCGCASKVLNVCLVCMCVGVCV